MKQLDFAIIGYGSIAKTHANAAYNANLYLTLPFDLNLKTIYSRSDKRVPLGSTYTNDIGSIMNDDLIAFIDICSPNDAHLEYIKKGVDVNKPIYCEKPITESVASSKEALRIINSKNITNGVALVYRFSPAIQLLKKLLEDSKIGPIIQFNTVMHHKSYLDPSRKGRWRTLSNSGGGALLDLGVHSIDMIHYLMGETKSVDARSTIHFKDRTNVDEISSLYLTLKSGVVGQLEVSRIYGEQHQSTKLIVYGELGSYSFDSSNPTLIEHYDFKTDQTNVLNAKNDPECMKYYVQTGSFIDLHMATLSAFADEVVTGITNPHIARFKDALIAQTVVECAYQSSDIKQEVNVE